MILRGIAVGVTFALTALPDANGQTPRSLAAPYTQAARKQAIDSVTSLLDHVYANPDTGAMIARYIRTRAATGTYAAQPDWQHFARVLTQDLQHVNGDSHLFVDMALPVPANGGGPRRATHGVEEARRLEGNVGYLRMSSFLDGASASQAFGAAMRFLAGTDAIILDLRNSRGGDADLANTVVSHFTGPDTALSLIIYDRTTGDTTRCYTKSVVPGPRRPDVPLYILTDDVTRSAAEDVPFVLQNMHRATIVGGQSAGAGRNNAFFDIGSGMTVSISFTRVIEPGTHREWERVGVTPNIVTPPESALTVAHVRAVQDLAVRAKGTPLGKELELIAAELSEASRAHPSDTKALTRYTGEYAGGQFVTLRDGSLVYQPRVHQPRVALVPMSAREFAAGPSRYRFDATRSNITLTITLADGSASTYMKVTPAK